jgi:hypothetical protein
MAGAACVLWSLSYAAASVSLLAGGLLLMAAAIGGFGVRRWLRPDRLTWRSAIVPTILVGATVTAWVTGVPLAWRWAASEASFNRLVATLPPRGPHQAATVPAHVGWYSVSFADVYPGGYVFTAAETDDMTDCGSGFAYLPHGPAAIELPGYEFVRIDGGWYRWACYS